MSSEPTIERAMKPFHCRSHECHAVLGITNGFQLVCGDNAIFTLRVTITCARCGQVRMWRPLLGAGAPQAPVLQPISIPKVTQAIESVQME
mgnify:CR=1 FL=1